MNTSPWAPRPHPDAPRGASSAPPAWTPPPPPPESRAATPPWAGDDGGRQDPNAGWSSHEAVWPRTDPGRPPAGSPPSPPGAAHPPSRPRGWGRVLGLAAVAILAAGSFVAGQALQDDTATTATAASTVAATTPTLPGAVTGDEPVAAVAAILSPSVVQIEIGGGLGSGVVYDAEKGLILTAAHVVSGASDVTLRLADGRSEAGTVVGADAASDIAVIQTDADDLTAATLALDEPVEVGQLAVAIGSPFGLDQTVTSGVISAVGRTVATPGGVVPMLQTDAPINPGNSGGALADRQGRVIGINDSIASKSGGNVGVGFAVPIDTAKAVADQLVAGEPVETGYLGVSVGQVTDGSAEGAQVVQVQPGSPAAEGGLETGDVITGIDGDAVSAPADVVAAIRTRKPGTEITLDIDRQGRSAQATVTLAEAPTR